MENETTKEMISTPTTWKPTLNSNTSTKYGTQAPNHYTNRQAFLGYQKLAQTPIDNTLKKLTNKRGKKTLKYSTMLLNSI